MKNKQILGALAVASILATGTTTAMAVGNNVVDPDQNGQGTLTVFKHEKIAGNGVAEGNGKVQSVTGNVIEGINFQIRRVTAVGGTQIGGLDLTKNESWKTLAGVMDDNGAPKGALTYDGEGTTTATNEEGKVEFTSLAFGLYEVRETGWAPGQGDGKTVVPAPPFYVTLPFSSRIDEGTVEWNYNPVVYPKNQLINMSKTVNDEAALAYDDEMTYTITSPIAPKSGETTTKKYVLNDRLSPLVAFQSAKVTVGDEVLTAGTDYDVTPAAASETGGETVTITFKTDGLAKLDTAWGADNTATVKTEIVAKRVKQGGDGITENTDANNVVRNKAFVVPNDSDQFETPTDSNPFPGIPSNEVKTVYSGIKVMKVAAENETVKLQGAEFQVYKTEEDAKNNQNPIKFMDGEGNVVTKVTTNDQGEAVIKGLRVADYSNDATVGDPQLKYYLAEVKAPNGRALLAAPVEIGVNTTQCDNPESVDVPACALTDLASTTITNAKGNLGVKTPLTGGEWLPIVGVAGALAVAGGTALMLKRRREN